ncbi:MAG TPA: DUF1598 domain-containing protein, partial [Pirellulales bacterium]|nr:DUF1598 domain-containing protein [Pirellulales bacterium]
MRLVTARGFAIILTSIGLLAYASGVAFAQGQGQGQQAPQGTNSNSATLTIIDTTPQMPSAGVAIDKGVLRTFMVVDVTGEQTRNRMQAAKMALNPQVQQKSKMRKISLQRLEAAVARQLANDRKPTDEMRYLAGLTRVTNVFFYPETGDIVLAGPAEGWFVDIAGRVVGLQTGRAIVELQDLVTALRAYPAGQGAGPNLIGCSIDATQDGLRAMQEFVNAQPKAADISMATPEYAEYIVNGLRTNLGLQKVRIDGVPPTTHFAQVMVEADYR